MEQAITLLSLGLWLAAVLFSLWWLYGGSSAEERSRDPLPPVEPPDVTGAIQALKQEIAAAEQRRKPSIVERVVERVLPAPPPVIVEKRVETIREVPARVRQPEPWKVEFRSGSGRRMLGREKRVDRRPAQITYVGMDGLRGSFVQDHQLPDGTWVYRRVSVER